MELVRKEHEQWHFADDPRCDWAKGADERDELVERREVDSLDAVDDVCRMCRDLRDR